MISGAYEATIRQEVEIPEAIIRLRSDGIIHVHYKKNTTLDVELQMRMRDIYKNLNESNGKYIFSADEGFIFTREARENGPRLQKETPILYFAIIASNLAYKIIANFYIKVVKPAGNYKLVSSLNEAVNWLNTRN